MPSDFAVTQRPFQPMPDFNGIGKVDSGDFLALGMPFGASRGDAKYGANTTWIRTASSDSAIF